MDKDGLDNAREIRHAYRMASQPWRPHLGWYPKHPRAAALYASISELIDLYTRLLHDDEVALSVDEQTS
jgi:hypothetical protein